MSITNPETDDPLLPKLRVMQIIALALVAGPLVFLAIILLMPVSNPRPNREPIMTWVCLGAVPIQVLLAFLIPGQVARRQRRLMLAGRQRSPEHPVLDAVPPESRVLAIGALTYQVKLLIRLALLEGGALFVLLAYMQERQWPTLALAVVLLGLMAASFPTRDRLERWLAERPDRG